MTKIGTGAAIEGNRVHYGEDGLLYYVDYDGVAQLIPNQDTTKGKPTDTPPKAKAPKGKKE